MKILLKGKVYNPTGIATANREIAKQLLKMGIPIQTDDIWHDSYGFNKGLESLNNPINFNSSQKDLVTIFADYPQYWNEGFGKLCGYFLHEGTRLIPGWNQLINRADKLFVCSEATRNLFKWNDVVCPIKVVPYGTNPEVYKPAENPTGTFVFLSVNSWTGNKGDRKGTDLLIKAFDEEFKDEDIRLVLKIGTFWQKNINYEQAIVNILGHKNDKIIINGKYVEEEELVSYYQKANCFVAPTRGEAFGLTIINSMACALPVCVTKDVNSGHMDFCKGKDSVLWIDAPTVKQGDPRFYTEGNMLAEPDLNSLKKQMRYAYENYKDLRKKALKVSEDIRENWSWKRSAEKLLEAIEK